MGRQLGVLRGIVNALLVSLQQAKPFVFSGDPDIEKNRETLLQDLQTLSQRLGNLQLRDIAPRDLQAEAHAREHGDIEGYGTDDALARAAMRLELADRPNGTQELASIQKEVHIILRRLGIDIAL